MSGRGLATAWLCALALWAGASATARADGAIAYLESLKGRLEHYRAPSEIDPRFTLALYVSAGASGPNRQRMWVLQRSEIGGPWRLGMWDAAHWKKADLGPGSAPAYSWPVSTGRHYRGDRRSGETPTGVFAIDERKSRWGRGWMADGMIHVMHIDYHYRDGRISGVAFHGTTPGRYRRLGSNESHGCIRMHQTNALALLERLIGKDGALGDDLRWGEVPRYWREEKGARRFGYVRDGSPILPEAATSDPPPTADRSEAQPATLTKTGFRAIAVIFKD